MDIISYFTPARSPAEVGTTRRDCNDPIVTPGIAEVRIKVKVSKKKCCNQTLIKWRQYMKFEIHLIYKSEVCLTNMFHYSKILNKMVDWLSIQKKINKKTLVNWNVITFLHQTRCSGSKFQLKKKLTGKNCLVSVKTFGKQILVKKPVEKKPCPSDFKCPLFWNKLWLHFYLPCSIISTSDLRWGSIAQPMRMAICCTIFIPVCLACQDFLLLHTACNGETNIHSSMFNTHSQCSISLHWLFPDYGFSNTLHWFSCTNTEAKLQ